MAVEQRRSSIAPAKQKSSLLRFLIRCLLFSWLHVVYGVLFLLEHLVQRPWRSGLARETSAELQRDAGGWEKLPRSIAIAFSHSGQSRWRWRGKGQAKRIRQIAEDVSKLVRWCMELRIDRVAVFDAPGLARHNSAIFCDELAKQLHIVSPPLQSSDADAPAPSFLVAPTSETSSPTCRISLLSEQDGKHHIALVARRLTEAAGAGYLRASNVTVDFMQEKMQSSLISEPELLIVLGEPSLRLHGFPPWHIRLTEIYHEPSLSLLGPARLTYRTFRKALSAYSASEQRRGR